MTLLPDVFPCRIEDEIDLLDFKEQVSRQFAAALEAAGSPGEWSSEASRYPRSEDKHADS